MTITYVNDLRLSEMATGDNSGTWGNVTNVNLELIGEALGYGTEAITTNADAHTSTIADGSTDPVRALYVEYTGTLDSACTITIGPNTVNKVCFIENGTSGSQNIIISQGSGANVTIPAGDTKAVYLNGAGSGAAVVDAFASLNVVDLTVSGDIDVDGTSNLDVIDVDGAANFAADVTIAAGADLVTATAGTSNFRAGVNAGDAIASGGNYNVCVGDEAGTGLTTADYNTIVGYQAGIGVMVGGANTFVGSQTGKASTDGYDNTAVGYAALTANTKGGRCTAIGRNALISHNVTSAGNTNNTAVGYSAGANLTTATNCTIIGGEAASNGTLTGTNNTVVGKNAAFNLTSGASNTIIGALAGDAITTASNNTAVGGGALGATTGRDNTAVGFQAGTTNIGGLENTAVGMYALRFNTTGNTNTAMGNQALHRNTEANLNAAFGYQAGEQNLTGSSNTLMGAEAGSQINSGNENTFVGYKAGTHSVSTTTGEDNTLIGAYSHTTNADHDTANVLGYNVGGEGGYTTVGNAGNDIRAVHGNVTWATVSDQRYKKEIIDSTAGLSFINALRPRTFKYKNLGELPEAFRAYEADSTEVFNNSNTNHGFIAQEVKAAIDADSSIKDGFRLWDDRDDGSQEVAEAALIPILVKAVQELSTALDAALARVATLEG